MSFRVVAWQLLYFWRDLESISPQYDDCPGVCGETGKPARDFCEACPIKEAESGFEADLIEALDERAPGKWQNYGIDNLRRTVVEIANLPETDRQDWTIKTDRLVKIWQSEKNKMERIDRWNAEQERKAANQS